MTSWQDLHRPSPEPVEKDPVQSSFWDAELSNAIRLRDPDVLEDVLDGLMWGLPAVVLTLADGTHIAGQVVKEEPLSDGRAVVISTVDPCPEIQDARGLLKFTLYSANFLLGGMFNRMGERWVELAVPCDLFSLARRDPECTAVPLGTATVHWARPLTGEEIRFPVTGFAATVVELESRLDRKLIPKENPFPMALTLHGRRISCHGEIDADGRQPAAPIMVHLTGTSPEDRAYLFRTAEAYRSPSLEPRSAAGRHELHELMDRSGYLKLRTGTEPLADWYIADWDERLSVDIVYRTRDGGLLGHVSVTRAYSHTWLGHQLATRRGHVEMTECRYALYIHFAMCPLALDGPDSMLLGYYDRSIKWHQIFFESFIQWMGDQAHAVIVPFDRFEEASSATPAEPPLAPDDAEVRDITRAELPAALALIRQELPELAADAFDIFPDRLVSRCLHEAYANCSMMRGRRVLVLLVGGELKGVALCEIGSRELSLFNVLNTVQLYFRRAADAPSPGAQLMLVERARAFYAKRAIRDPLIITPPGAFLAPREAGLMRAETMGCIVWSGRGLMEYQSFVKFHFGRWMEGQESGPPPSRLFQTEGYSQRFPAG
jgi:hypothetical protein